MSEKLLVSDIVEKYSMEIMKKSESCIPLHIKSFSDFSREYMVLLEQGFLINCNLEKKILGNLGIHQNSIKLLDEYLEHVAHLYANQIDTNTEYFKIYLEMRLTSMKLYNNFMKEFANKLNANEYEKQSNYEEKNHATQI